MGHEDFHFRGVGEEVIEDKLFVHERGWGLETNSLFKSGLIIGKHPVFERLIVQGSKHSGFRLRDPGGCFWVSDPGFEVDGFWFPDSRGSGLRD